LGSQNAFQSIIFSCLCATQMTVNISPILLEVGHTVKDISI